nr:MAG TPA: hypothetical protein [Caudoviricetes sp.]
MTFLYTFCIINYKVITIIQFFLVCSYTKSIKNFV